MAGIPRDCSAREDRLLAVLCRLEGNRSSLRSMESNMSHRRCAHVVIFEDFGNGQTKLTMIGNETMEDAKNSGQLEAGMRPRKSCRSYCGASEGEIEVGVLTIVPQEIQLRRGGG